jgi:hypothetical protein
VWTSTPLSRKLTNPAALEAHAGAGRACYPASTWKPRWPRAQNITRWIARFSASSKGISKRSSGEQVCARKHLLPDKARHKVSARIQAEQLIAGRLRIDSRSLQCCCCCNLVDGDRCDGAASADRTLPITAQFKQNCPSTGQMDLPRINNLATFPLRNQPVRYLDTVEVCSSSLHRTTMKSISYSQSPEKPEALT